MNVLKTKEGKEVKLVKEDDGIDYEKT